METKNAEIVQLAKDVIRKEAAAISALESYIDGNFESVVSLIFSCSGRVVITGIGKSAIIANKIVATLNSTGTPALFMHAADAIHGDLGMIQHEDIVICISKSGNTPEIKMLVPLIKRMGNVLVALVSTPDSYLGNHSDYVLFAKVDREACPNNLAPTTSTTAQLVMGDALAICLLKLRGFTPEDFARYHPGGSLGKRLYLRVGDLISDDRVPMVSPYESIQNTIFNISSNRLGATVVISDDGKVEGIITDGDVRRMVERGGDINTLKASDIMTRNPKTIDIAELAVNAFRIMESNKITSVVVLDCGKYAGLIHIHDILREGIV